MEIGEFHNRDGWYFKRMEDGAVRIRKTMSPHVDSATEHEHVIPPNEWASILAHTSGGYASGDTAVAWDNAQRFHEGRVFVRRAGDPLVIAGAANAEEERAKAAEQNGEPQVAEVARINAADLRDIHRRLAF